MGAGAKGEVITSSFTFAATANAILAAGCSSVFADIEEGSCNLDPAAIEAAITPQTVAIMPVHFAGQCCRMDEIVAIANRKGLLVIEDSAEAVGATCKGRMAGSFGIGCFSFYPTKNITTGEGGMLTTNDSELASRVRAMRHHGVRKNALASQGPQEIWNRVGHFPGYNFRMTDLQAAIGRVQLAKLDAMNERRRSHARRISIGVGLATVRFAEEISGFDHVFQMLTARVDISRYDRNNFVKTLIALGVGASVHFDPPLHQQPSYIAEFPIPHLPITERVARSIVTLPMYPDLSEADLNHIIQAIKTAAED
jgi:dTDP-4-amino-4,6-dideoxygalactose transaminase